VMKESPGKITYPGRKQIFRRVENGIVQRDRLGLISETSPSEQPLMQLVFKQGQRMQESDSLSTIAERTRTSVASLPSSVRDIDQPESIPLDLSDDLSALIKKTRRKTIES
ncbi:MAG: nicotinate phosphoribosyltransferase, partial [Phormidesmis sp. CAN_BIN44]|nr:nicotinate phosphoribosyltransferase [Phormidesmis sp. CAN_BIN44]